jgi:hypothetical protein
MGRATICCLLALVACGQRTDDDGKSKKGGTTDTGTASVTTPDPTVTDPTVTTDTDTDTTTTSPTTPTAWWVDTGDSAVFVPPPVHDDSGLSHTGNGGFEPWSTDDSGGFFRDSGCDEGAPAATTTIPTTRDTGLADTGYVVDPDDRDGDGFLVGVDCDDFDPFVYPGAPERCDGVDTDCDPTTGEDGLITVDAIDTYTVLADAVKAAPPGAVVLMCAGTYDGPIWVKQTVSLVGLHGADATTLQSTKTGPNLLRVQQGNLRVDGLTIRGGNVDGAWVPPPPKYGFFPDRPFWPPGAGLSLGECGSASVHDSVIIDNHHYASGGGVGSAGAPVSLWDSQVVENHADRDGGGIWFDSVDYPYLRGTDIEGNVAGEDGGGLYLIGGGVYYAAHVTDNVAQRGGGIYCAGSEVDFLFDEYSVTGNEAEDGGGWYAVDCKIEGEFERVPVSGNTAVRGGGAYLASSEVIYVDFHDNVAEQGGGVYLGVHQDPTSIRVSSAVGNDAYEGGGVYAAGTAIVGLFDVENNVGGPEMGGIVIAGTGTAGIVATESLADEVLGLTVPMPYSFGADSTFACSGMGCDDTLLTPGVDVDRWQSGNAFLGPMFGGEWGAVATMMNNTVQHRPDDSRDWEELDNDGEALSFGAALATDGLWGAVGYPWAHVPQGPISGGVALYERGFSWVEHARVFPPQPEPGMHFGASVALDGDLLAVGAPFDDTFGDEAGAVYVYEKQSSSVWSHVATLGGISPEPGEHFGDEVALDGTDLVVAASDAGADGEGMITVFDGSTGSWVAVAERLGERPDGHMGAGSIDIADGVVVAPVLAAGGLPVEVRVFERDTAGAWGMYTVIDDPADYPAVTGRAEVALDGPVLVVGVPHTDHFGVATGAVYRFADVLAPADPVALYEEDRTGYLHLGRSVYVADDRVFAVGNQGVYVFEPSSTDPAW